MSLPLLHAGRTNPGISAALDLKFASTLSLTSSSGITPSFSRASIGTYFDSDGILRTMGLNLLLYSEDFTNGTYWSGGSTARSGNTAVAPDGSLTADTITFNSGSQIYQNPQISSSIGTVSVYVKKVDHRYFSAQIETSSTAHRAVFDLDTALVTDTTSGTLASISDAGNGWFRCSVTKTVAGTTAIWATFQQSATATFSTGSGSKQFYMWGAQSEIGSSLNTYSKTTSASNSGPRFDHTFNGTSWISRGLLVEEQRTNLCTYSEDFGNAAWTKSGGSVSTNQVSAPDGLTTADKFTENSGGGVHYILGSAGSIANSTIFSVSAYVKKGDRKYVYLTVNDGTATRLRYTVIFDLDLGQMANEYSIGSPTNSGYSIVECGNGWFRISARIQTGSSQIYACELAIGMSDSATPSGRDFTNPTYTGNGSSHFYCWGVQSESGSFPTSYIPTTSASATRSADVCQITGGDFSGFWNASEGSFVAEFDNATPSSGPSWYPMIFAASDAATNAKRMFFFGEIPTNNFGWLVSDGTTVSKISPTPYIGNTTPVTSAMCYKLNDLGISLNGGAVLTDLSQPMPTGIDRLQIGHNASANTLCGHIARLRYFNKRLTDKQLEDLCRPEEQLKLDLKFSENLSLTPVVGPTPSFSRASTGTYFNSSGVLTSAAINAPRFDHTYNGTSWISRGLLVEEQRTNLCLRSEDVSNASWSKFLLSVSADQITSPDGNSTADKLVENTSTGTRYLRQTFSGISSGSAVSFSAYFKAGERQYVALIGSDNVAKNYPVLFDLNNGTVLGNLTSWGAYAAPLSSSITNVGNGWYRCCVVAQLDAGVTTASITPAMSNTSSLSFTGSYTGDGSSGIYQWGAQVEAGAFATSYIPTTSASATRSADVCQITGSDFSSFWNASEGSFVTEADSIGFATTGSDRYIIAFNSSGTANIAHAIFLPSTGLSFDVYNSAIQARISYTQPNANDLFKLASCYRLNDFATTLNGGTVQVDTSGTIPTINNVGIGHYPSYSQYANCHISRLRYYAIRLPNRLLIAKSQ